MPRRRRRRTRRGRRSRLPWILLIGGVALVAALTLAPQARNSYVDRQVARHADLIETHALAHNLPPELVRAVVKVESSGRPDARSNRGAVGLMQITPVALRDVRARNPGFPEGDLTDPDYNLRVGTTYLAQLLRRFDYDLKLALASYHMGPTKIGQVRARNPGLSAEDIIKAVAGPKTRAYLDNVLRAARRYGPES